MDPGETPAETALREAHEEVGLDPSLVTLFAELDHLSTVVSRSHIVPVVGRLPEVVPLGPASSEVERVIWLPLGELVRPDTYHAERWGRSPTDRLLHFFELEDETVWGATAFMLVDLLTRIGAAVTS
jgi:8-oxo-dGTP pyrophosphatase MutT (NUDIX family)